MAPQQGSQQRRTGSLERHVSRTRSRGVCLRAARTPGGLDGPRDIELVTQVSLDRWPRFAQQALVWGGPASVAVYVPCPPSHPLAPHFAAHLERLVKRLHEDSSAAAAHAASSGAAAPPPRLTVTPVHASSRLLAREGAHVLPQQLLAPFISDLYDGSYGTSTERLYPINALRNTALRAACASHVFLVDGDFMPSAGLRNALLGQGEQAQLATSGGGVPSAPPAAGASEPGARSLLEQSDAEAAPVMWVLPALELRALAAGSGPDAAAAEVPDEVRAEVPSTLAQLAAAAGVTPAGPGRQHGASVAAKWPSASSPLRPFHCGRYPQPQPSIRYGDWLAAALRESGEPEGGAGGEWQQVPYHEYFELYGIVRRDQVPPYDERFRGYGLNKVQHAYHMAAAGFDFRLLTRHFCVTVPHARSPSFQSAFGTAADPAQRARVEALYNTFKQEMHERYGYRYGPPAG